MTFLPASPLRLRHVGCAFGVVNSPFTQAISTEVVEAGDESFFLGRVSLYHATGTKVSVIKRILNAYVADIGKCVIVSAKYGFTEFDILYRTWMGRGGAQTDVRKYSAVHMYIHTGCIVL